MGIVHNPGKARLMLTLISLIGVLEPDQPIALFSPEVDDHGFEMGVQVVYCGNVHDFYMDPRNAIHFDVFKIGVTDHCIDIYIS